MVKLFQNGNHQAVTELFHRYHRFMLTHACKYIFEKEAAEDVVQDVWERVILGLRSGQYEEQHAFSHWLYKVAHFTVTREIEKRILRKKAPLIDLLGEEETGKQLDTRSWSTALQKAFKQLPESQAEILRLHYFEEMSFDDIGKKLHITTNAATSTCSKARKRLRVLLEAMGMQW